MAKQDRVFKQVAALAQRLGGVLPVNDPTLAVVMSASRGKDTLYRLPTQMYAIRKHLKLEVKAVRVGRKVVAYEFPAFIAGNIPVTEQTQEQETAPSPAPVLDAEAQ